ncbi:hypothetical protein [Parafrankia sp. EUN1f]|nr:hypothetical protein [Parafrankia sp. EUN1f]
MPLPVTCIGVMAKYGVGTPAECLAASLGVTVLAAAVTRRT